MVTTKYQGQHNGMPLPEEKPQPTVPQPTFKELLLKERNHVFEVLKLNDGAIGVMNQQNIMNVLRIISTKKNIFDGLASAHRENGLPQTVRRSPYSSYCWASTDYHLSPY